MVRELQVLKLALASLHTELCEAYPNPALPEHCIIFPFKTRPALLKD